MPNHTRNVLTITGPADQLAAVDALLTTDGQIDFRKIVPMPEILGRVISPYRTGPNGRAIISEEGEGPSFLLAQVEATVEQQAEIDACPHNNWYDFATAEWGTKWNAYDQDQQHDTTELYYLFNTAWCEPDRYYAAMLPAIRAIAPDVTVTATARYEDDGYKRETTTIDSKETI